MYSREEKTIGSIDTSEFLVAVAAGLGFIIGIGGENINYAWLLAGGVVAAPIAAWLVRLIPPRVPSTVIYLVWAGALAYSIREYRRDEARARTLEPEPV